MNILIAGGTGLIGRALSEALVKDGHTVKILTRRPEATRHLVHNMCVLVKWDGHTTLGLIDQIEETDVIVNLAGESIAGEYRAGREFSQIHALTSIITKRWTNETRSVIKTSRVNAGRALVNAVQEANHKPNVFVQASALGYYGSHDSLKLSETSPSGTDFLADVCQAWEHSTLGIAKLGLRRVVLRTGLVLAKTGGILPIMLLPFRLFAGGPIGTGQQFISWIHIKDQVSAIQFLIDNEQTSGSYNLCSPNPVTNAEFGRVAGKVLGRPNWMPAPTFALKLILGEKASLVLDSQRAVPDRLSDAGYRYQFELLEPALRDLILM